MLGSCWDTHTTPSGTLNPRVDMGIHVTGSSHSELEEADSTGDFLTLGLEGLGEA